MRRITVFLIHSLNNIDLFQGSFGFLLALDCGCNNFTDKRFNRIVVSVFAAVVVECYDRFFIFNIVLFFFKFIYNAVYSCHAVEHRLKIVLVERVRIGLKAVCQLFVLCRNERVNHSLRGGILRAVICIRRTVLFRVFGHAELLHYVSPRLCKVVRSRAERIGIYALHDRGDYYGYYKRARDDRRAEFDFLGRFLLDGFYVVRHFNGL